MTTKQLGNIGEAKVLAKFVEMQIPVFQAFGDNEKCDLIAEFNGKLQKIQIKTSEMQPTDNSISFSIVSSTVHRKNGVKHIYTSNEVDYFALYHNVTKDLILIPQSEVNGMKTVSFRTDSSEVKNQFKTRKVEDYTFEKIVQ